MLLGLGTRLANLFIVVQKRVHLASLLTNCTHDERETKERARRDTCEIYLEITVSHALLIIAVITKWHVGLNVLDTKYATACAAVLHRALVRVLKVAQRLDLENALFGLVNAAFGAEFEQLVQQREGLSRRNGNDRKQKMQ